MYVIKLENTVTHQIHQFESDDMNNGNKLYYEFNVNTLELVDGEYILTLCDSEDNVLSEDVLRIGDFNPQTLQYKAGGDTYISIEFDARIAPKKAVLEAASTIIEPDEGYDGFTYVEIDANALVDNAKNEGYNEGVEHQKGQLSTIDITENGVYTNENGYSEVVVNIPDLNGSYDEGYEVGRTDGYNQGKDEGYTEGYDKGNSEGYGHGYQDGYAEGEQVSYGNGYEDGKQSVAADARVLNVTENGIYCSEFSTFNDYYDSEKNTGVFDDGTCFFDYMSMGTDYCITDCYANADTVLELWWRANDKTQIRRTIIGTQSNYSPQGLIKLAYDNVNQFNYEYNGVAHIFTIDDDMEFIHFYLSKESGVVVNGVHIMDVDGVFSDNSMPTEIYINATYLDSDVGTGGDFGMVKIDGRTFVPTENGWVDYGTQEYLTTVTKDGKSVLQTLLPPITNVTNLVKTINVNVPPKINIAKSGLRFGESSFKKIPEWADWEGITNMYRMFYTCGSLMEIPLIDTSNVTTMERMLYQCRSLKFIPLLDTSKVLNMSYMFNTCESLTEIPLFDTSNVTTADYMFCNCYKLITIPQLNTSKVKNMSHMFDGCTSLVSVPPLDARSVERQSYGLFGYSALNNLTDFGGLIGLKASVDGNYSFDKTPNLSYESCINILNGLYDFTGNGETPTSSQGKLKVHQNFLNTVGDDISIGTNKGWTIKT